MCESCKNDGKLHTVHEEVVDLGIFGSAGISLDMTDENLYANFFVTDAEVFVEAKKRISYCPFCGQKLSEVK